MDINRNFIRLAVALLLGMALAGAIVMVEVTLGASHFDAYKELELGMPQGQAQLTLERHRLLLDTGPIVKGKWCVFSDPWREYYVRFDLREGRIIDKYYFYKRPPGLLLSRLVRDIP